MRFQQSIACMLSVCLFFPSGVVSALDPFEFSDGDMVVLLGDGLIEQEQYSGWIELAITAANSDKQIHFRNLGWSGDTPAGASRFGLSLLQAGGEPADEGWKQLVAQLELTKPSVVILGYGMSSALEHGLGGVDRFREQYEQLLAKIHEINSNAKLIFLSPVARSDSDVDRSMALERHASSIASLAVQNNAPYIDLMKATSDASLHQDAIRLNQQGYQRIATEISNSLGLVAKKDASLEQVRHTIVRKNQWWFYRSRPANMAYVFGFRRKEQGQNAVEIPQFDALIAEEEKLIVTLLTDATVKPIDIASKTESKYAKFTPQPIPEFTVDDAFEVTLWAENPMLNKPIHINFDPKGRLWVASSEAYPMIEVGQSAPDKIIVLEDSTGSGKADKATVFADGLLIPTGILPGNGGVYVAQSTDLLYLKDTNGDGKADFKERVLSGFGTEDTHHNLHTLLWGPDGRLYMNQSIYTRTDAETPQGVTRLKAGGGFRLNPANLRMQIFFRGLWNSWGHQFDRYGNSFLTDGAGFEGVAYTFPGAMFNPTPGARRQLDLISPGRWPKFASMEIISGDSFPKDWQGAIVTCDFRANRVTRFSLSERGAGFATQQESDIMRTAAPTFRPIDVKQGPDGALYIADWSNPIINHGEVDFRDERRDRWHGRIWRVAWKSAKSHTNTDLTKQSDEQLLANLLDDDKFTREQSRRVLIERGESIIPKLDTWTTNQKSDESRLQALWMYQALNRLNQPLLTQLLRSQASNIRAAAIRVLSDWSSSVADVVETVSNDDAIELLTSAVDDDAPRVRLEAVRALSVLHSADASLRALNVLNHEMDKFLDYALWLTINESSDSMLTSIVNSQTASNLTAAQLEFVLTAIEPTRAASFVRSHLENHPIDNQGTGPWIELVGKTGDQGQLTELLQQTIDGKFDSTSTVRVLRVLLDATHVRHVVPSNSQLIVSLLATNNDRSEADRQTVAIQLCGQWKIADQVQTLAAIALQDNASIDARKAAINALRQIQNDEANSYLAKIGRELGNNDLKAELLTALAAANADQHALTILRLINQASDENTAQMLWRSVLNTRDIGSKLASKVQEAQLSELAARAGMRVATEGRSEEALIAVLLPASGQMLTAAALTPEKVSEYVASVNERGDAKRGEMIYRRAELACVTCHAIGGVGGRVGPDMTSIGASAPLDYLIESLFVPNAKIKEGYHSMVYATEDGQIVTGIELSSDEAETFVRTATNAVVRIPTSDIAEKKAGSSLMPSGIIDRLSQQEQVDLIRFISMLGRPGDFDASRGGVARVIDVLAGTHLLEQAGSDRVVDGSLTDGWKRYNALVNGEIHQESLVEMTKQPIFVALVHVYLRCKFDVASNGPVGFEVENVGKFVAWIDGNPTGDSGTTFKANLESGSHTLLMRLDARSLPDRLKIKSTDVTWAVE